MHTINKTFDDVIKFDVDNICDLLSTGIDGIRYWGTTNYKDDDYAAARQKLVDKSNQDPCWEEVLAQMLLDGKGIEILDIEEEGDDLNTNHSEYSGLLTLDKLRKGIQLYILNPQYHSSDQWTEVDAEGGDQIIQFAMFEDLIFG